MLNDKQFAITLPDLYFKDYYKKIIKMITVRIFTLNVLNY
jgi:hypothetical protein